MVHVLEMTVRGRESRKYPKEALLVSFQVVSVAVRDQSLCPCLPRVVREMERQAEGAHQGATALLRV